MVDVYLILVLCFVEVTFGGSRLPYSAAIGNPEVHKIVSALLEQHSGLIALFGELVYQDAPSLPIKAGDAVGEVLYFDGDTEIARLPLVAGSNAEKATLGQIFNQLLRPLLGVNSSESNQTPVPADGSLPAN